MVSVDDYIRLRRAVEHLAAAVDWMRRAERTMCEVELGAVHLALERIECSSVPLPEALALTLSIAERDPSRYDRAAGKWIGRAALEEQLALPEIAGLAVELRAISAGGGEGLAAACATAGLRRCAEVAGRDRGPRVRA